MSLRALLCLAALTWTASAEAQRFCANTNTNLRVMTANVHCWAMSPSDPVGAYDMDLETRMERIASIIEREDPDVVALQGVFEDDCRDALIAELEGTYPSFVSDIRGTSLGQTAGMMLFSKIPFETFTAPYQNNLAIAIAGSQSGTSFDETAALVAWHAFDALAGELIEDDVATGKAAAMVRVRPRLGCAVNVAFAHLQGYAILSREAKMVRQLQLEGVRRMITETLGEKTLSRETTFLLGALEIEGNRSAWATGSPGQVYSIPDGSGGWIGTDYDEWTEVFEPAHVSHPADPFENTFFRCAHDGFAQGSCEFNATGNPRYLTEAWGFEVPPSDLGQTSYFLGQTTASDVRVLTDEHGDRKDFILHSQPGGSAPHLCPQRLRRVFFFDPDGAAQFYSPSSYTSVDTGTNQAFPDHKPASDHFFVVGDFLFTRSSRCSPSAEPIFGPTVISFTGGPDFSQSLSLGSATTGNRRQYAWFKLDSKGTFSIGSSHPTRSRFEVYHHSDLSTPISPSHGLTNTWTKGRFSGPIFDLPDPPYFIRYQPSETVTLPASFSASVHRHLCSSAVNDFCLLSANQELEVKWPGGQHLLSYDGATPAYSDAMYFVAMVDRASSGANPKADFFIETASTQFSFSTRTKLFRKCGFDQTLPDCGSGTCNAPVSLTFGPIGESNGNGTPDLLITSGNETSGALAPPVAGNPRPVLLRVRRSCAPASCTAATMRLAYLSSLYRLTPISLTAWDEEDSGSNDDEIFVKQVFDQPAPGGGACAALPGFTSLGRFDENDESNKQAAIFPSSGIEARTFVDIASFTVCEEDDPSPSDNDFIGESIFSAVQTPLPYNTLEKVFTHSLESNPDASYEYTFRVKTEEPSVAPMTCP